MFYVFVKASLGRIKSSLPRIQILLLAADIITVFLIGSKPIPTLSQYSIAEVVVCFCLKHVIFDALELFVLVPQTKLTTRSNQDKKGYNLGIQIGHKGH